MTDKLLIVNNSLKNLRGHFFETSLAVAEAARALGLHPVLGAHESCRAGLVPSWLEFHPLFTTDHWMAAPLPQTLRLAEQLLPLRWHQPAQRLLRLPWNLLSHGRHAVSALRQHRSHDPLQNKLRRAGIAQEYDFMQRFRGDLQRFLTLSACRANDQVFLPTAHGRELAAIQRLIADSSPLRTPRFHLEFRHDLEKFRYQIRHRVFFDHVAAGGCERIHLYTDTEELSREYEAFSRLRFGVLPIPFRARLLRERLPETKNGPICVAYFGDVRDEKGFHWLPDVAEALRGDNVCLLIQASLDRNTRNPRSASALGKLKSMGPVVRLVGEDGPLSPEAYFEMVSLADVLLCPFDAVAYRSRSSGTFAEAVSAGTPTVVPANTWMAHQQPRGSGEVFRDKVSCVAAVRRVCANLLAYRAAAAAHKEPWLALHSPASLVRTLVRE